MEEPTLKEKADFAYKKWQEFETKPVKKTKKFRLPKKVGSKARKGYITLMKINTNGHIDFKKVMIQDQTIMEDDIPRLAASGHVLYYKKNPVIILPEWSVKPFSLKDEYFASLSDGSNSAGYRLLLNRMKTEIAQLKKKVGKLGMSIGGLIIAAVIGYALITGGGA